MGNSTKNPEDYDIVRNYRNEDWQLSSTTSPPQLWRNRKTHQLAEIYRLYSIPSIQDMNRYEMRSTQENFVKVYHIALSPKQAMCFNQEYVRLLIEFIPVKLQNVSGLELQEALTILVAAFKGFNTLSNQFGLIQPQEELIGFNQWGKAKVWLNKQFNNNFPAQSLPTHFDKSRVEASHVRKIFDLIERKSQAGQLPIGLKQLFRVNNPSYLQAILIVQQFAYQNLLSLQRYIRTDLYARKPSVYSSNMVFNTPMRQIRGMSNEKYNNFENKSQSFSRPQLKRMHSVDALHTQRLTNHSQSTVSFTTMPFKQNLNYQSGIYPGHHIARSCIPKVHFQKSSQSGSFMPFLTHKPHNNSNYVIDIKMPLSNETTEHVKCVSILNTPHSEQPSPQKTQQVPIKKQDIPSIEETTYNDNFQEKLKQSVKIISQQECVRSQTPQLMPEEPKIQSNINISTHQDPSIQGPQTCRSIIDKVESEMRSEQNEKQMDHVQYERDEQIQVSGTFNYKALYEKDNADHLQHPLEQIGEEDDYSKEKEYDQDSKIKEQDDHLNESNILQQEVSPKIRMQNQYNNIPINFQSFAPTKLLHNQLASFAPNQMSFPTQQSIQSEENVQTSKSFEYQQNEKNKQQSEEIKSIEEIQEKIMVPNHQYENEKLTNYKQAEDYREIAHQLQAKKRVSIDLCYPQNAENPFYAHCTPVQSKFDVVVKRDSIISQQSQRHQRPSAFAHLDTDEQIENYVRTKYLGNNKNTYQEPFKVGRVESQYQKHYVNQPQSYDFTKKQLPKKSAQRQNVRPHLRPAQNKISNIVQKPEEDFLDVNFLEKSLDKRYSANIKKAIKHKQQEDELNIAKLDEGLMKFSTSKASLTQKSSKDEKNYEQIQSKVEYKNANQYLSKWDTSTGFQYQSKPKQPARPPSKKKKSVRIDNTPTHEFTYQLSSSDYGNFKGFTKQTNKSPFKQASTASEYQNKYNQNSKITKSSKITQLQKQTFDDRYNKYVKNSKRVDKSPKTPSINNIMSIKGQSRLMLSPIPEKRWEDDGRLSYDQLRSFLWG